MDRKLPEKTEIEHLIRLSASARGCLESEAARIRRKFDIPARIRGSLTAHPTSWLFGSLASGLVASLLFTRRPKASKKIKHRGMAVTLLGLALTAARPLAKVWVSNQVGRWLQQIQINSNSGHTVPQSPQKNQFP